jgi:O-antigen ligase
VDELARYGCRHINLEEIQNEKAKGHFVMEVFRTDPNVDIRSRIYQQSFMEIKAHPVFGIGWGNIGRILGTDENGHALNSSNIFLETWLGAGIIGFFAIVLIFLYSLGNGIKFLISGKNAEEKVLGIFLMLGLFALLIPDLFNAGVFLAILWTFFGIAMIKK